MSPYPLIYTPDGIAKPSCCPHLAPVACLPGRGPDGGEGLCWGGSLPLPGSVRWTKTPAGWWVALDGITPQALRRVSTHPRILRWLSIPGTSPDHRWRVPVLVTSDEDGDPILAVDRILTADRWKESDDLAPLVSALLAVHAGRPLHESPDERNAACVALALDLLALGQWVDRDLAVAAGWVSESLVVEILRAALNRRDDEMTDPL
jgi:hypothetical protein